MSLLFSVVFASRCRSTHHKLAVDALRHLRAPDAEKWRALFLHHHAAYLKGAKAPDDQFKDFKNHVLHVREGEWGGAIESAEVWRLRTVRALQAGEWAQAAHCAGVMSHYLVDPHQPFHTHQTEEENVIHRAVEWSFNKSYTDLQRILETDLGGYPEVSLKDGDDWLADLIRQGANAATQHYETIIDHYDFAKGSKDPKAGLDQEIKDRIAAMIGRAAIALSRALDRIFADSKTSPPTVPETLDAFFLTLDAPVQMVLGQIENAAERKLVGSMYDEFKRTGKVRDTLSDDDRAVRALYAVEVANTPLSSLDAKWPREIGVAHGTGTPARGLKRKKSAQKRHAKAKAAAVKKQAAPAPQPAQHASPAPQPIRQQAAPAPAAAPIAQTPPPEPAPPPSQEELVLDKPLPKEKPARGSKAKTAAAQEEALNFTLFPGSPVEDGPSIGPKTSKRLAQLGVHSVADLLSLSPATAAVLLDARHITAQTIHDWQSQAQLCCTVPDLKGRSAIALVACGVRDAQTLSEADPAALTQTLSAWIASDAAERAWGDGPAPTQDDVQGLINRAKAALAVAAKKRAQTPAS